MAPTHARGDVATSTPTIAVVVPAHADRPSLHACLEALDRSDPPPDELVVVVDGADPDTVAAAEARGVRVVAVDPAGGPSRARNAGVAATSAEVVFFVDSDVAVPTDAIGRLRTFMGERRDVDAIIGSYDDDPPAPGFISQYKNLLNHHVHQTTPRQGSTFWGACGAVRRTVFERVGGFDEGYTRPCIEDLELGYRLRDAGSRIEVLRELQVTHLKRWTARSMVRADVFDRAVPWSALIIDRVGFSDELNISRRNRAKTVVACVGAITALTAPFWRAGRLALAAAVAALAVLDRDLLAFLRRRRGLRFAAAAAPLHWATYLYSAAAFTGVLARRFLPGRPGTSR